MTWETRAACRGKPTAWWFPEKAAGEATYTAARHVCGSCPVRAECLAWALTHESGSPVTQHGMFGGLTPAERAAVSEGRLREKSCAFCGEPFVSLYGRKRFCSPLCHQRSLHAPKQRSA